MQHQGDCGGWQHVPYTFDHSIGESKIKEVHAEAWATEAGVPQFRVAASV